MRKLTISITFTTDASDEVISHIAQDMRWQLDSLTDGSLDEDLEDESCETSNLSYELIRVEVKSED